MPELFSPQRFRLFSKVLLELSGRVLRNDGELPLVLEQMTESVAQALDIERVGVWLYDETRFKIRCLNLYDAINRVHTKSIELYRDKYPRYFRALEEERVITAHEAQEDPRTTEFNTGYLKPLGIVSMLDAPIHLEGKMIGVVCHEHVGQPRHWTPEEEMFAASVADAVALVIQAAELRRTEAALRESQHRRIADLRRVLDSVRLMSFQRDLTTVLERIAEESALILEAEPGGIGLIQRGEIIFFDRMWVDGEWKEASFGYQLGESIAGKVAATRRPIIVNEPLSNPDAVFPLALTEYYAGGVMDVPILDAAGTVVGVLEIRRPRGRAAFTETDCGLIEALANQAAVAIHNAALYREVEEKNTVLLEKNIELGEINFQLEESRLEIQNLFEKEQEVTRRLRELNQMKTNFLIVASHEIRTPLTVLQGHNETLLEGFLGELNLGQQVSLDVCRKMIQRLGHTMNDILEVTKINERKTVLNKKRFDFNWVFRYVMYKAMPFIEKRGLNLIWDTVPELHAYGDRSKLELAFYNLIENAVKFTPDGGLIHVVLAKTATGVSVTVRDTGIGVPADEIERIFDMFYTSADTSRHSSGSYEFSARGTGLGLTITKSYIEAHGGTIRVESPGPGQGTAFFVTLPDELAEEDWGLVGGA